MDKGKIIITDDNEEILDLLGDILVKDGYEVVRATNGKEALEKVEEVFPNLIMLDITMPGMTGLEVKAHLNENSSTARIPVIFLTGKDTPEDKIEGLSLGVDDYITKPFHVRELLARVGSVLNRRKFYEEISMTDGLTGLRNVHFFNEQLSIFFSMAKRYKRDFSLAVIDVDDFKSINDTHGHMVGDFVLKKLAGILKKTLRKSDIITRYGGDEFTVILPEINEEQARRAMERVKEGIDGQKFPIEDTGKKISFSISAGIAAYNEDVGNKTRLFEAADADMYKDKGTRG